MSNRVSEVFDVDGRPEFVARQGAPQTQPARQRPIVVDAPAAQECVVRHEIHLIQSQAPAPQKQSLSEVKAFVLTNQTVWKARREAFVAGIVVAAFFFAVFMREVRSTAREMVPCGRYDTRYER
jgi:hypothetical protein